MQQAKHNNDIKVINNRPPPYHSDRSVRRHYQRVRGIQLLPQPCQEQVQVQEPGAGTGGRFTDIWARDWANCALPPPLAGESGVSMCGSPDEKTISITQINSFEQTQMSKPTKVSKKAMKAVADAELEEPEAKEKFTRDDCFWRHWKRTWLINRECGIKRECSITPLRWNREGCLQRVVPNANSWKHCPATQMVYHCR